MPVYVYRSVAPGSSCEIECGVGFSIRQNLSDKPLESCPVCEVKVRRAIQPTAHLIRHSMKGDCRDYRDDLARFAGDPQAYVDGPRSLQKLIDQRKREGWQFNQTFAAPSEPKFRSSEEVVREAFQRAKDKGFTPNDE